ncbi:MAG: FHA domain-containing protein [Candidatus Magnetobacterium sp. LHC-1]|uniref:FHA domain-containing protein n=1 Tax=Candidatus Magnetobacterium casense TaxID=1455061 RepID=A0ABS6S3M8_9BACT|nr:FHA domain-containing protein [Candidatus Magnetobacterium casensis]MBF0608180.1 FHA domain-containing protein [Nitrospirota bacterium]MBV6343195.1 FHA domain-containing protein [Candidatus Magnetobacterium casensis]
MSSVKVCPTCNVQNAPTEVMCERCLGDISGVAVQETRPVAEEVVPETGPTLMLTTSDGNSITVRDGDVVGRMAVGADVIEPYKTVSRRHARFTCEDGTWYIEDLNTTNETYLDDVRLSTGKKVPLLGNQRLTLSSALELTVVMA